LISLEMELIQRLSQSTGLQLELAEKLLSGFVKALTGSVHEGNAVAIPSFGTFQPTKVDERISVDSKTGKRYLMPPEIKIELKSSVVLRKKLLG